MSLLPCPPTHPPFTRSIRKLSSNNSNSNSNNNSKCYQYK